MATAEIRHKKKKKLGSYPYISVLLSISLSLFVMGLFGLLILHANNLSQIIQQNIEVQVYLNRDITENERIQVQKVLASKDYVLQEEEIATINYISKEDAAQQFLQDTGEDIENFLGENPLRDAYVVKIQSGYQQNEGLRQIQQDIERIQGVYEVTYVENLVDSINSNLTKISLILIGFSIILLLTVIILINNTIKLALFSQRFLIRSMQLVGAKAVFIKIPFLKRAALHGISAGIIASGLLLALLNYANNRIENLDRLQKPEEILILFGILLFMGAAIGYLSTFRAINKYLKMSLDDLY
ncbi:MAG: cell division protein FtsX [Candidatus Cyclobacteriaceae bacterium M3_2C_046]